MKEPNPNLERSRRGKGPHRKVDSREPGGKSASGGHCRSELTKHRKIEKASTALETPREKGISVRRRRES